MANGNRKASGDEIAHAKAVIREAFPEFEPVFGGHSAYGGHRTPRDHTISFRLRDRWGAISLQCHLDSPRKAFVVIRRRYEGSSGSSQRLSQEKVKKS